MSTVSTNLGLTLAEGSDIVNVVTHIANNFQGIDNTFASHVPTNQAIGDAAAMGTALVVARSDHKHGMPAFGTPVATGTAISNGVSANLPRADHVHTLNFGTAVALDGNLADGAAGSAARSDHKHSMVVTAIPNAGVSLAHLRTNLAGNATEWSPSGQIAFPATANLSANANTLDDYEEGTWTPVIGGTATYTTQVGIYRKIGSLVYVGFYVKINLKGTGSATDLTGLPFSIANTGTTPGGTVTFWATTAVTLLFAGCVGSVSGQAIRVVGATAATAASTNNFAVFGNSTEVEGALWYTTTQ